VENFFAKTPEKTFLARPFLVVYTGSVALSRIVTGLLFLIINLIYDFIAKLFSTKLLALFK